MGRIDKALADLQGGNRAALDELMPTIYAELRRLARAYLRSERPDHTLEPTALVNEVYLRLAGQSPAGPQSRTRFLGLAAHIMRHVLIDHAVARNAAKRAGRLVRVAFEENAAACAPQGIDILDLDRALSELSELDPQQARVVELRFFGGLTVDETAEVLGLSGTTVDREWATARLWLLRRLRQKTKP